MILPAGFVITVCAIRNEPITPREIASGIFWLFDQLPTEVPVLLAAFCHYGTDGSRHKSHVVGGVPDIGALAGPALVSFQGRVWVLDGIVPVGRYAIQSGLSKGRPEIPFPPRQPAYGSLLDDPAPERGRHRRAQKNDAPPFPGCNKFVHCWRYVLCVHLGVRGEETEVDEQIGTGEVYFHRCQRLLDEGLWSLAGRQGQTQQPVAQGNPRPSVSAAFRISLVSAGLLPSFSTGTNSSPFLRDAA